MLGDPLIQHLFGAPTPGTLTNKLGRQPCLHSLASLLPPLSPFIQSSRHDPNYLHLRNLCFILSKVMNEAAPSSSLWNSRSLSHMVPLYLRRSPVVKAWVLLICLAHRCGSSHRLGCVYHNVNKHFRTFLSMKSYKGNHQSGKFNLNTGTVQGIAGIIFLHPQNSVKKMLLLFSFYSQVN